MKSEIEVSENEVGKISEKILIEQKEKTEKQTKNKIKVDQRFETVNS